MRPNQSLPCPNLFGRVTRIAANPFEKAVLAPLLV
jgi:hypothetical protein